MTGRLPEVGQGVVQRGAVHSLWADIDEALTPVRAVGDVRAPTVQTHEQALKLAERYGLSVCDALIVSAALLAGCKTLWSEDMQDGRVINRKLTIRNPFARAALA